MNGSATSSRTVQTTDQTTIQTSGQTTGHGHGVASDGPAWTSSDLRADPHALDDKPERVRRMFAGIAQAYDLNNRLHSFGRDQAWRRRAVALAGVQPHHRVLDVACGTGDLTECFARAGAAESVGVDFTEAMLEIARSKAERLPEPVRPQYRVGDAMALEVADASFDVVSIAFGIRNVARPEVALGEFRRVLRPGGRLMVLEFTRPPNRLVRALNDLYTNRIMPLTAGVVARLVAGGKDNAYRYLPRSVETFLDHRGLREAIVRAGFAVERQELLTLGVVALTVAVKPAEPFGGPSIPAGAPR